MPSDTVSHSVPHLTDHSRAIAPINALLLDPVLLSYFETLNASNFQATAELFAETGKLYPPFAEAVMGRAAIAAYLEAEATGIQAQPFKSSSELLETGNTEFTVTGKVQTALFGVNLCWSFIVSPQSEILSASIKLLGSLEELLSLRQS